MSLHRSGGGPLVSIGIPTYNRRNSLERALDSALAQTYQPLEIVVSDNASTDGTPQLLAETTSAVHALTVVTQHENLGPARNFEATISLARGEYFMWLADDDAIDPEFVERCVERLQRPDSPALVSGLTKYVDAGVVEREEGLMQLTAPDPVARLRRYAWQVNRNEAFYGLARRDDWLQLLPLRNRIAEDWSMVAALIARGPLVTLPEVSLIRSLNADVYSQVRGQGKAGLSVLLARPASIVTVTTDVLFHPAFGVLTPGQRRRAGAWVAMCLALRSVRGFVLDALRLAIGPRRWESVRFRLGRRLSPTSANDH